LLTNVEIWPQSFYAGLNISFIFVVIWCYNELNHCNEKGMRLESATVPAAVNPDHALRDDGFLKYLPLSAGWRMGRL
jgi:hypothetical protein